VDELFGEKIDIIPWCDVLEENVSSALAPAKVEKVVYNEDENIATAVVPDYQLSLAIGKEGQNVRLAAKLAGMKIDIKSHTQYFGETSDDLADMLDEEGYLNPDDFMTDKELAEAAAEAAAEEAPGEAAEEYVAEEDAEAGLPAEDAEASGEAAEEDDAEEDAEASGEAAEEDVAEEDAEAPGEAAEEDDAETPGDEMAEAETEEEDQD
jgi:N utilization substance protein A